MGERVAVAFLASGQQHSRLNVQEFVSVCVCEHECVHACMGVQARACLLVRVSQLEHMNALLPNHESNLNDTGGEDIPCVSPS